MNFQTLGPPSSRPASRNRRVKSYHLSKTEGNRSCFRYSLFSPKIALMKFSLCMAMKQHSVEVRKPDLMNSNVADARSKTNSVKVVQKQPLCDTDNAGSSYSEIEASLGFSSTSIHSILHEHLAIKMISSRWIPHNLTIAQ